MITISLCMIVKNEEAVLARCLNSIAELVDEMVIVDTGSTDKTKEIAQSYGAKVYDFPWQDDFSLARNFAFDQATQEYLLWLDADDVLEPKDQAAFLELKKTLDPAVQMVMLPYHVAFDENGIPTFSYYRERLMRRDAGFRFEGEIHEAIVPRGLTIEGDAAITHRKPRPDDSKRNLHIFEKMLQQGKTLGPRLQFYYARELMSSDRLEEAEAEFEKFLKSGQGWIENNLDACRDLAACRARKGDDQGRLEALLSAMSYGPPRSELCCDIGQVFFERNDYQTAIFWYELALSRPKDEGWGFHQLECNDYIPYLQLCVCWDRLGDVKKAEAYNDLAGIIKPDAQPVQYNRAYFASLKN